jgi:hypothetical protein
MKCFLVNEIFFWKNYDGDFLSCLEKEDANKFPKDLHDGMEVIFFWRKHLSQNFESWLLLAYSFQGC